MLSPAEAPRSALRRWRWAIAAVVVLILILLLGAMTLGPPVGIDEHRSETPTFTVKKGPLTISVLQSGTVRSSQAATLRSEVAGKTTILHLVEEGSHVKQGDLLVELDSSELIDKKIDEEITVQNSQAAFVQAREDLEIARQQAEADVKSATVDAELAALDLKKFTEGQYKQDLQTAQSKITLADATLKQAKEKLDWSQKLQKLGYITSTELQGDELSHRKADLDLQTAKGELEVLEKYTYQRQVAEFQNKKDTTTFLLLKAKHKAVSNVVQAEATLKAKELAHNREQSKLDKLVEQIAKCKIKAPVDGMVVYVQSSRGFNDAPLSEGVEVREQQELIRLPTTTQMLADVKIHESVVDKIRVGQIALITTEALPGKTFTGSVRKISLLPDSQNTWLNPDLKVYNTEIEIQGDITDLRPGMSCRAEVVVAELADALYVPMQAVLRIGDQPSVYVLGPSGAFEKRAVQVGLDNNRMVQIASGLSEGDAVSMAPPLPPSVRPAIKAPTDAKPSAARAADAAAPAPASPPPLPRSEHPHQKPKGADTVAKP